MVYELQLDFLEAHGLEESVQRAKDCQQLSNKSYPAWCFGMLCTCSYMLHPCLDALGIPVWDVYSTSMPSSIYG